MITFVMTIYTLLVFALAAYLFSHRHQRFLTLVTVPAKVTKALNWYVIGLIAAGIVAAVSLFVPVTWLKVLALLIGALTVGILGVNLPRYIAD